MSSSVPIRSVLLIGGPSSLLRSHEVGDALHSSLEKVGARSVFIDPAVSSRREGLPSFLESLAASPVVVGEVPAGGGSDPKLLLVLGTALGANAPSTLLMGPGTGAAEQGLVSLLHATVLQYRDTTGLVQGLAYFLDQAWKGTEAGTSAGDAWKDWRAAQGLLARGSLQGQAGLLGEEVASDQELLRRFSERREPPFQETTLRARINLASSLRLLGRSSEALQAYAEAAQQGSRLGGSVGEEGAVRAQVLASELLLELSRPRDALATLDRALEVLEKDEGTELRMWKARAALGRGLALSGAGDARGALSAFSRVVERFGTSPEAELQEYVAKAMIDRAITLTDLGEKGEALREYDAVVQRFGDAADPELFEQVTKARLNRGLLLGDLGRRAEEISQYDEIVEILDGSEDASTRPWLARALLNKGVALGQQRKYREELSAYSEVVRRFEGFDEPTLSEPLARALLNEGLSLMRLGQDEEAAFAFDRVIERWERSSDPALRPLVQGAHEGRSRLPGPSW